MALDKAIDHGKEHRKQYRGSKCFDGSCRNHGGCDFCKGNRMYQTNKAKAKIEYGEIEYERNETN